MSVLQKQSTILSAPTHVCSPEAQLIDTDVLIQRGANENTKLLPTSVNDLQLAAGDLSLCSALMYSKVLSNSVMFQDLQPRILRRVTGNESCFFL